MKRTCRKVGLFLSIAVVSASAFGQALFKDGFEANLSAWSAQGTWARSAQSAAEGFYAANDSPNAYYENNTDAALTLAAPLDFSGLVRPAVSFSHRYALEDGYDFGRVEATSNGTDWIVLGSYTGNKGVWTYDQLELDAFAGRPAVTIRFRLTTDASLVKDGWMVDAVAVGERPVSSVLSVAAQTNPPGVALHWTAVPGAIQYVVLRSTASNFNWRTATIIATFGVSVTNTLDITASPKTAYYYRLVAVDADGLQALSAEQAITTPVTMDFPFLDTGEGGVGRWNADPPWTLSTEAPASPTHAWTDSEGGDYANTLNSSLTLARRLDLTQTRAPALSFRHQYAFQSGDIGLVEVSANNGTDWTVLGQYTAGTQTNGWTWQRYSLAGYTNSSQVLVRFRITSTDSGTADGWRVDDISVAEMPEAVAAPVIDEIRSLSMRLSWPASTNEHFAEYRIYRSTSAGVNLLATPAGIVTNRAVPYFTDTGLAIDTVYYYKVYQVTRYGAISPDGGEASARTLNNPLPFADDFEGGLTNWLLTGSWGTGTNEGWSGKFLGDSPDSSYPPSRDSYAQVSVDLRNTDWPVLKFKDRFALANGDWMRLEVYAPEVGWTYPYGVYIGSRTNWAEQVVDMSPYKGRANVTIRFRVSTDWDGGTVADGWNVDDVRVEELQKVTLPYPFYDFFENGFGSNWWHAGWTLRTNDVYEGQWSAWDTPDCRIGPEVQNWMGPAGWLNLSNAVNPQLTFRVRGKMEYYGYFRVHISEDGITWPELGACNLDHTFDTGGWIRKQADLTPWAGKSVRLRFYTWGSGNVPDEDVKVDRIVVTDRPAGVYMQSPIPHLKSVDLSWTTASNGASFLRYELYRSPDANVDLSDTRLAVRTSTNQTSFTDTGLNIGQTYYYGIFVVDTNEMYASVNMRAVTTVPQSLPVVDPMESLANWDATGNWGTDSVITREGAVTIGDSPGGAYVHNLDSAIQTAVDLRNTQWPVLRFRDRFGLGAGDWLRVEIYTEATGWTYVYGHYEGSRTNWEEQVVDLSPWKNYANVRIKFRIVTDNNAGTVDEGWNLDDLKVEELQPAALAYPFFDFFENGFGSNWWHAGWTLRTNDAYEGQWAAWDTPDSRIGPEVQHWMGPAGWLNLSNAVNPQLTFRVRGRMEYHGYFRVHISEDGVSWPELAACNLDHTFDTGGWIRKQADLTPWAGKSVRLRFYAWGSGNVPVEDIKVDRIVVGDRPAGVSMLTPTPHLKSVDLSWTAASNGASFLRYELYRSTDANVELGDMKLATYFQTNQTSFTDTGLNIGQTYYYGIFVVDTNEMYASVSSRAATTIPKILPVFDPMDDLSAWDVTGNWGPDSLITREGAVTIGDSPGGAYVHNLDSAIQTSVDLRNTQWPVLRFRDRFSLGAGDWVRVEIYTEATGWTYVYGHYEGSRTNWEEQVVDLSPWKNYSNVRIKFRIATDNNAGTVDEGWNLDDLKVEELQPAALSYPFFEYFENGFGSNWWHAGWTLRTNGVYEGQWAAWDTPDSRIGPEVQHWMGPAGWLDLSNAVNPQLTFRIKGKMEYYGYFRVQISENGVNWPELGACNLDHTFDTGGWIRKQADLTPWAGKAVRLRFYSWGSGNVPVEDIQVDRIVVGDRPWGVTLADPTPHLKTVDLSWTAASNGAAFTRYELYRSPDANVDLADTKVATFFQTNETAFTDTGLSVGGTYYYGIFVVDTNGTYSLVSARVAVMTPHGIPFADLMTGLSNWDSTGSWGVDTLVTCDGAPTIGDSPGGSYNASRDTSIQTSIDLRNTQWPVLRFKDRYALTNGDWFRLEVSSPQAGWAVLYGCYYEGTRTNWEEQTVSLAAWRGNPNVTIRLRVATDGDPATVADGWNISGLRVEEQHQTTFSLPFYEDFEAGFGSNWLHAGWTLRSNDVYEGKWSAWDTPESRIGPEVQHWLEPAGWLDLTHEAHPQLVFWIKAYMEYYGYFRVHITENGINWGELGACNLDHTFNTGGWIRKNVDLTPYAGKSVKLRFYVWGSGNAPAEDIKLDRIGIGGATPSSPIPRSPIGGESTIMPRPMLTVRNAIDFQGDPLTYRFEVYADPALSAKLAEVPAVAENAEGTSWQVDLELANNRQYWWRSQASDGGTTGQWSQAATFFVNRANLPPTAPVLVAPTDRSQEFRIPGMPMAWNRSVETQSEDAVTAYQVQLATDAAFSGMVADTNLTPTGESLESHTLGEVTPTNALALTQWYYWRVRALDAWGAWSEWSQTNAFILAEPPTAGEPPSSDPMIRLSDNRLDTSCLEGESPLGMAFSLQNSGGGTLSYTVTDDAAWLEASPASGSSIGEWDPVNLAFDAASLPGGVHTGTVTVASGTASNSPQRLLVVVSVTPLSVTEAPIPLAPAVDASVDPVATLDFMWTAVARASNYVLSVTRNEDAWSTNIVVEGGLSTGTTVVAEFAPGSYAWQVRGANYRGNGPLSVAVPFYVGITNTLQVASPHDSPSPAAGAHRFRRGTVVTALVDNAQTVGFTTYTCQGWTGLGSVPGSGATNRVVFTITNDSSIAWRWSTNTVQPSAVSLSAASLAAQADEGGSAANGAFQVRNGGAGALHWQAASDVWWMTPVPANGSSTGEWDAVTVVYQADSLLYGTYTGRLVVADPSVPIPAATVTVTLVVRPNQVPAQPVPLSPAEGQILPITGSVGFVWATAPRAAQYRAWIGKDGMSFTNRLTVGTETNLPVNMLFHRGLYTWFVHGINHLGVGAWSTTVTFRVERLVSPEGCLPAGSGVSPFRWTPTPGATAYRLVLEQHSTSTGLWTLKTPTQEVAAAEWSPSGLTFTNGSYRWSVQEQRDAVWQPVEPMRYFQLGVPGQSAPLAPSGTLYLYKAIPFVWTTAETGTAYQIQIKKGTAVYSNTVWMSATQLVVKLGSTAAAYTWRVRAMNGAGIGAWSPALAVSYKLLGTPKAVAPVKGAGVGTKPVFQWKAVAGATGYTITVKLTATGKVTTYKAGAVTAYQPAKALPKGAYTWQIQATNPDQKSKLSAIATFTVR